MPTYEEEDAYPADTRNYSAGNNALLQQLVENVRQIRDTQGKQGEVIVALQVSMGKMETQMTAVQAQVVALQPSGRAEAHVGYREIWQGVALATALIILLAVVLWFGRP